MQPTLVAKLNDLGASYGMKIIVEQQEGARTMPRFTPYVTSTSFISSKTHFRLEETCFNGINQRIFKRERSEYATTF